MTIQTVPATNAPMTNRLYWPALLGNLVALRPRSVQYDFPTATGVKEAVKAELIVFGEHGRYRYVADFIVLPRHIRKQLSERMGEWTVAVVGKGPLNVQYGTQPWVLEPVTDEQLKHAAHIIKIHTGGDIK